MGASEHVLEETILLEKLKLWTERLVKIALASARIHCELADLGVLSRAPLKVDGNDGPRTVRLKERILEMNRERSVITRSMAAVGAEILEETTMEVVFPNGPDNGILSWMPGELAIDHWREKRDTLCERRPLPERRGAPPTRH